MTVAMSWTKPAGMHAPVKPTLRHQLNQHHASVHCCELWVLRCSQGRSQEVDFFIIRGPNHTNLYKNLIKI